MNPTLAGRQKGNIVESSDFELRRALRTILEPGQVTELRALGVSSPDDRRPHVVSGYFDDGGKLAEAALLIHNYQGIYFIPNPVNPALMARAENRVRPIGNQPTTSDHEIICRRWFIIDVDPVRPAGISSSEKEHQNAIDKALEIFATLSVAGWPRPIVADSGNGAHLLYRIDTAAGNSALVKGALEALASQFDVPHTIVDTKVSNPSRIWKLYGTLARKGDNIPDRPHRMARLLQIPDELRILQPSLLEELISALPARPENHFNLRGERFNLALWIAGHGLKVSGPEPWNGGHRWKLQVCPWNPAHVRSACILQLENGSISFRCLHNSCRDKRWADLRRLYESEQGNLQRARISNEHFISDANEEPGHSKPEVKIPGDYDGLRVGHNDVVEKLREHLPLGTSFFRRGTDLIKLVGEPGRLMLRPLNADMLRVFVDATVHLIGVKTDRSGKNTERYRPCSRDLAAAVLAGLSCHARVPECRTITSFPVWVRSSSRGWYLPRPGYDAESGHFFDATTPLIEFSPLTLDPDNLDHRDLVHALVANDKPGIFQHFPWANAGSAVNALAAVLTILMRPGIHAPTPLFLFTAPLERTGKTLLARAICRMASGKEICVQVLPESESEIQKSLLSSLRDGAAFILFDNAAAGRTVFSAALAAFITSPEFGGRLLGQSLSVSYLNRTTLFLISRIELAHSSDRTVASECASRGSDGTTDYE
jgi:hypothetical protein